MQSPLNVFLIFLVVLALIGAGAWLLRRFGGNRLGTNANRGRMPRLAVIDAAAVDGRRRLVLVRRDNIEHLLMIGGPTDIVVEPNIVRASPAREQAPPPRPAVAATEAPWQEPEFARGEPLDVEPPFIPEVARAPRTAFPEELPPRRPQPPRPPEPRARPSDPFAGLTAEPATPPPMREPPAMREPPRVPIPRSEPLAPRPARPEPTAAPKAPAVRAPERPQPAATADQNLAEMAQRLEAALRRPGGNDTKPEAAPTMAPEAPAPRPTRAAPPELPPEATAEAENKADAGPKAPFKNLEEEMASLLGRPKNSS
jgi:flagellar protein FliO/FliZ